MRLPRRPNARAALLALPALLLALTTSCGGAAPPPTEPVAPPPVAVVAPPPDPLDQPLPLDAHVITGKLPSGLTYYVLPHKKPEHRAQVWLAVNAGSVLEDEDQRGLAHFVEHMSFNGTEHFPKQALVDMLEKSGVAFGADLNAYTSFDETVYTLQVPTDKDELLGKALGVLRDWTEKVTFDPVEVEKERGVVLEEWRLGRGAGRRLYDKTAPLLFHGSKYAERLTIGKPEIIQHAPREALVRFYKDWYRPDLMAVIAVGDFSGADVEARIKDIFGSLPAPVNPRPRPSVTVPPHDEELVSIETDPEEASTTVAIISEMPHRPLSSARDYRRALVERLYSSMLNARLDEIRRKPNAPFLSADVGIGSYLRTMDAFSLFASLKDSGVKAGIAALLEEKLRVERHGFVASELDRAKRSALRGYERLVKERETASSRALAQEIVRNFLEGESMPGAEAELALAQKDLPTITLEELNQLGKAFGHGSRVITVKGPPSMPKPSEAELAEISKEVLARDIKPYDDSFANLPLMANKPVPGPVVATKTIPEIGVTEWTLKNGVRVVVKPTDFKKDDVRMVGFGDGGTSIAPDADWDTVRSAASIVQQGGVGSFDAITLEKILAGKVVAAYAQINELDSGIWATASPDDLESMFQLVNLRLTAPRKDPAAFQAWRARSIELVRNERLSPEGVFGQDMVVFETKNHPRRRPETPESLARADLDKALAFYKARFADFSGFTFVLVGNLDLARTQAFAETYLGSLPAAGHKEHWKDIKIEWPAGVAKKVIVKGAEPKARVTLVFHGAETWSFDAENDMKVLTEVLRIRLREILREDMGGVYGVGVSGEIQRRPRKQFTLSVSFACAPENVEKLEKAVFDEIAAIQKNGIAPEYLAKVKAIRQRAWETNLRDNGYWMNRLWGAYTFGDDPRIIATYGPKYFDKVTSDRLKAAAKKYAPSGSYTLGELRPASAPAR